MDWKTISPSPPTSLVVRGGRNDCIQAFRREGGPRASCRETGSGRQLRLQGGGHHCVAAFEDDADAKRCAQVFRPGQSTRESEWASMALARKDGAKYRRIVGILKRVRVTVKNGDLRRDSFPFKPRAARP